MIGDAHGALEVTQIPPIGVGTWPLEGPECQRIVSEAIDVGFRIIDTSEKYGNEAEVGAAIRASGVPREHLFVTSKFNQEHHSVAGVRRAYEASLRRTGLDYLDLFLIHWPVPWRDRYVEAWEGLVRLLDDGVVRAVGVSNFKPAHLERIITASGVVPAVNQIQLSVDLARHELRAAHARWGIRTQGWSPLGRGPELRQNPVVVAVAEEVGCTPAQVLLRWQTQQGITPVARSESRWQLEENLRSLDIDLADEHFDALAALDRGEAAARDSDDPSNGH